jgi:VRR-NUC domain-containing protein
VKEREFQAWIIQVAELHGWRVWHVPTPMRPIGKNQFVPDPRGRGLPDLIMLREDPPQAIFAEVKNETGDIAPEQAEFLRLVREVGYQAHIGESERISEAPLVQAFLWRPAHRDLIEAVLSAR